MRGFTIAFAALAMFTLACGTPASAGLIAYDGFDYAANGTLAEASGGTGWSANWSLVGTGGTVTAIAPGMSFGALPVEGNTALVTPTSGLTSLERTFAPVSSGTLYLSMLAEKTNDGTRFFGMGLRQGGTPRAFFGQNSGAASWSFNVAYAGGDNRLSGISHDTDDPTLLVFAVDFDAKQYRLYVDPTPGALEPLTPNASLTVSTMYPIDTIRLGAGYSDATHTTSTGWIDEVRIGTDWASVTPIPEPAGAMLLLCAVACGLLVRWRRAGWARLEPKEL